MCLIYNLLSYLLYLINSFYLKLILFFLHRSLPMQIKMDSETDKTVPLPRCRIQRHKYEYDEFL